MFDNKKDFQIIIACISFFAVGIFIGFNIADDGQELSNEASYQQEERIEEDQSDQLPPDMVEGEVTDLNLNELYLKLKVDSPTDFDSESAKVQFREDILVERLEFNFRGDEVEDQSVSEDSVENIEIGNQVLISATNIDEDKIAADRITIIVED